MEQFLELRIGTALKRAAMGLGWLRWCFFDRDRDAELTWVTGTTKYEIERQMRMDEQWFLKSSDSNRELETRKSSKR